MSKKLSITRVKETIGEDYKKWSMGDTVLIQAQTGAGKTFFIFGNDKQEGLIDTFKSGEKLIYLCNRVNLERQLKKDLLKKFKMTIPENIEELDAINKIKNVHITSYHSLAEEILDNIYYKTNDTILDEFDYIVADECHFIMSDSGFYNKCELVFNELVRCEKAFAIKIFMSATLDEMENPIIKGVEHINDTNLNEDSKGKIFKYKTGVDYSYLNPRYFKSIKDIIEILKADTTDEKWLIFVNTIEEGNTVKKQLQGIHKTTIIRSGSDNEELRSVINSSKFKEKVLVCTKAMDNGINIYDEKLKNVVVMAMDRTTFLQEIGRVRVDILNPLMINLYIPLLSSKKFESVKMKIEKKKKIVKFYTEEKIKFKRKYDWNYHELPEEIFYRDGNEWKRNRLGYARIIHDGAFAREMIEKFIVEGKFAYVRKQLEWLELQDSFSKEKLIEDLHNDEAIEFIKNYFSAIEGRKLFNDEQKILTEILKEREYLFPSIKIKGEKLQQGSLQTIIDILKLDYRVGESKSESKGHQKGKKYRVIYRK